jgi:hypothetical protein
VGLDERNSDFWPIDSLAEKHQVIKESSEQYPGTCSVLRNQTRTSFLLSQYGRKEPSAAFAKITEGYRTDEQYKRSTAKRTIIPKRLPIAKIDVTMTRMLAQFLPRQ